MHYVLQTSSTQNVNRGTYSKAVCGSDFGYAVCPVLWERYLACHKESELSELGAPSGPFALKLHFHLELSRLPRVLIVGRDSQARTAEI
jgi:hypothetical protein